MDGTILIVDDVATNRIVLKAKLSAARYRPFVAANGEEGLRLARKERPDLILLDLRLPDMSGVDLCRKLRQDPIARSIPLIALTSSASVDERLKAFAAGADEVFAKPCPDDVLLARVRNLLRGRQELSALQNAQDDRVFGLAEEMTGFSSAGVIAIVTDRKETGVKLRHMLSPLMRDDVVVITATEAFRDYDEGATAPDLFLIDDERGKGSPHGQQLVSDLRSRNSTRHAAICLLTPQNWPDRLSSIAFDLGVNDIVNAQMEGAEIAARLRSSLRRKKQADDVRVMVQDGLRDSVIDPVTGLHNRRYALTRLANLVRNQSVTGLPLAVLVADLDRFKRVNDRFGHAAGDQVLIDVGQRLSGQLRSGDLLGRFGGEEFLIALPDTGLETAASIAQRLRTALAQNPLTLAGGETVEVTASFGLAVLEQANIHSREDAEALSHALIAQADAALLSAKSGGRNMIIVAERNVA